MALFMASTVKIVILGNSNVGKTLIAKKFVNNDCNDDTTSTQNIDIFNVNQIVDGRPVTLNIWDTAGQERYHSLCKAHFRGADCCVLVYDVTNPRSFDSINEWKQIFLDAAAPRNPECFPFILLGNKKDAKHPHVMITTKPLFWAKSMDIPHMEVSAKMGDNMEEALQKIARMAVGFRRYQQQNASNQGNDVIRVQSQTDQVQKGSCTLCSITW